MSNYRIALAILFITLLTFLPGIGVFASIATISSYEKSVFSDPNLDIELFYDGITKATDIEIFGR